MWLLTCLMWGPHAVFQDNIYRLHVFTERLTSGPDSDASVWWSEMVPCKNCQITGSSDFSHWRHHILRLKSYLFPTKDTYNSLSHRSEFCPPSVSELGVSSSGQEPAVIECQGHWVPTAVAWKMSMKQLASHQVLCPCQNSLPFVYCPYQQ